ncbi:antitoxin Xre/MbcA/ParS toxin-binding domain-containing protein [Halomonas sp. AOP42-C2-23]
MILSIATKKKQRQILYHRDSSNLQLQKNLQGVMKICQALMTQSSKLLPSSGVRLSSCLVGIKQQRTSWFHNEAIGLDWQRPIDVMEEDAQQVLDLITRMDRGFYK